MDNQEIAVRLTVAAIEWLQRQEDVSLDRNSEGLGATVGNLYKAILKTISTN